MITIFFSVTDPWTEAIAPKKGGKKKVRKD